MDAVIVALITGSALLHSLWNVVLKKQQDPAAASISVVMVLGSFGSLIIFLYALKFEGAAHIGTLRNLSILFTAFGSMKIGETLTRFHLLLIVGTVVGTVLIGL